MLFLLIIFLVAALFLYGIYVKKFKPLDDIVKGSDTQILYIIISQFLDPKHLDSSFLRGYQDALQQDFADADQRVISEHIHLLFKCMKNHMFAMEILDELLLPRSKTDKADLIAKAINLSLELDENDYFRDHLVIAGSAVRENYVEIVKLAGLTNADVKQGLINQRVKAVASNNPDVAATEPVSSNSNVTAQASDLQDTTTSSQRDS